MKHNMIKAGIVLLAMSIVGGVQGQTERQSAAGSKATAVSGEYQYSETRELVQLVNDAADLVGTKGQEAFTDLRVAGSKWRQGESYVFVLDTKGNMIVHPDPTMEGKNELDLKDINGKPIIRGLINVATMLPAKRQGWYHYEWTVPGGLLPRWKSTYVKLVTVPSGERYVVGSGVYNDRMEKSFVVDAVKSAVGEVEKNGKKAFAVFRDPKSQFIAKDAYIFVIDMDGVELVNPAFPNLEGRNMLNVKDAQGKEAIREMVKVVQTSGVGWVDYLWAKPGESVPTLKSAYVSQAKMGKKEVIVGCGVYLADAPKAVTATKKMSAAELTGLVRDAAALLEKEGEKAYAEFRKKGSKWFSDDTYIFVRTIDEKMAFHAADPTAEGRDMKGITDVIGRPYGKMFKEAAASSAGEGWVHYMYPEPGNIFPSWKSAFVKGVTYPSGKRHIVGCGIYNMDMDQAFIQDVVSRASALIADKGEGAFGQLRDKTGPFVFMDTYVFVVELNGKEVVNPGQPSLEGSNLMGLKDVNGKLVIRECIEIAMQSGSGWIDYYWYRPGQNTPGLKHTYVQKVEHGKKTYVVGSGYYPREEAVRVSQIEKVR